MAKPTSNSTDNDALVSIEGIVDRITYENEQTGFRVLRLESADGLQRVTVVGTMPRVVEGSHVRVLGKRQVDRRYGEQVRAETVVQVDPGTREGIIRYLGSGLIPGIGPGLARRIVERFGDQTLAVLDERPERLREVPGIGAKRVDAMVRAWREQRVLREVMVFLQAHGVSASLATRVFRRYGAEAIRIVQDDPYRLALEVWGVGFHKADGIARSLGIRPDDTKRIVAGLLHRLDQAGARGHVFLPEAQLLQEAESMLELDYALVEQGLEHALVQGLAVREDLPEMGRVVYAKRMWNDEQGLADRLSRLSRAPVRRLGGVDQAIEAFERGVGAELSEQQRRAVRLAASEALLVVTGGPGTGKTTVLRALLHLYDAAKLLVQLVAPTGRASRRMAEAAGHEALTVHRLLQLDPRTGRFQRDETQPVDADVVIVDEASMLDMRLAHALTRALRPGTRLVLVGDVDQLPSVGPGAVLRDVIESGAVAVVRLDTVFRQARESLIVQAAHRIVQGRVPPPTPSGPPLKDFYTIKVDSPEQAVDVVVRLTADRIPSQFGLHPVRDVQVLSPMHRGPAGVEVINGRLQDTLNPDGTLYTLGAKSFRQGDKVMQLYNDYDREIFNGDVGFVRDFDAQEAKLVLEMDGRNVSCDTVQAEELALAYACSIHKSQGSEYPAVIVVMLSSQFIMLSRNLLYTAVTRGKKLVVLVTDDKALRLALAETRREERYTYLFRRLERALRHE